MTLVLQTGRLLALSFTLAAVILLFMGALPPHLDSPRVDPRRVLAVPEEVRFMRAFVARVNPSLPVEDPACAELLPGAIYRYAESHGLDWPRLLALAWQESDFDCHAKNPRDKGGAYGPFQIRRLWEPVIGDPRPRYFDPELAVERVVQVIKYYRDTARYDRLVERRFRNPLLCLYNTGETRRVNMAYCRQVGRKLERIQEDWRVFQARRPQQARHEGAAPVAG